jgi:hypothetical protein
MRLRAAMSQTRSIELDDPDSLRLQSREWIAERIGWVLIAAALLAAVLGLLGPGPLSHRYASSSDGRLSVEYYSIQRHEAPAELIIRLPDVQRQDEIRLAVSREFTDRITTESITPEPERIEMQGERLVYHVAAADSGGEAVVVVRYRNTAMGRLRYEVALEDGPVVSISHFVCP